MARQLIFRAPRVLTIARNALKVTKKQPLDRRALSQTVSGAAACGRALSGSLLESWRSAARSARAAVHQCMYGCVRAAQEAPNTRASCMMAQKAARLARWLGRRARTAEPPARPRAPRSHPHGEHHAYEKGARGAAQARGRGRRGGGVKALALAGAWATRALPLQGAIY